MKHYVIFVGDDIVFSGTNKDEAEKVYEEYKTKEKPRPSEKRAMYILVKED